MLVDAILAHAHACAPAECCGYVIQQHDRQHYFPCTNQANHLSDYFEISVEQTIIASSQGQLVALVHSHPNGAPYLSSADRKSQLASQLPWWLVCEGKIYRYPCVPALLGRQFVHGRLDCYSLFRDAYALAGIGLPNFHRADNWWQQGEDLYLDNLKKHGFYQINAQSLQAGNIVLCCYGSSVANHAAIYCGNQQLLHHVPHQLSKREVYSDRWQRLTHSIWRHQQWRPSSFMGICNDLANASH